MKAAYSSNLIERNEKEIRTLIFHFEIVEFWNERVWCWSWAHNTINENKDDSPLWNMILIVREYISSLFIVFSVSLSVSCVVFCCCCCFGINVRLHLFIQNRNKNEITKIAQYSVQVVTSLFIIRQVWWKTALKMIQS